MEMRIADVGKKSGAKFANGLGEYSVNRVRAAPAPCGDLLVSQRFGCCDFEQRKGKIEIGIAHILLQPDARSPLTLRARASASA